MTKVSTSTQICYYYYYYYFFKYGFNVSSNVLGHIWNGRHENNKNDPTVGRLVGSLNWTVGRR